MIPEESEKNSVKMVETTMETTILKPKNFIVHNFRNGCVLILAIICGYIHYKYVSTLFENNRNFSYLSELEREMSLRTEMGFYYSYYKTVVQERPFVAGITKLMYDRLVEYPKDVNAFNRFNIHPEVLIGALYRYLEPWINTTDYRQCHMVFRGDDLSPVESCVGIGEPILFYLEAIWLLAGLLVAAVFVHATVLSESIFGGILAVVQYFANHGECTRVQWSPNERENLAVPLLCLQTWLVTLQLRDREKRTSFKLQVSIFMLNCLCLLCWQFSQFIFFTQIVIFFFMEEIRVIDLKTLCIFLHSHYCGLHMAVLLLQGNDMLKTSIYTSFFLVVSAYGLLFSSFKVKVKTNFDLCLEIFAAIARFIVVLGTAFYLKRFITDFFNIDDDSHIFDILKSKLTSFKSFHTLIYTCSDVFDFLPLNTIVALCETMVLPSVIFISVNVVRHSLANAVSDFDSVSKAAAHKDEMDKFKHETDGNDTANNETTETDANESAKSETDSADVKGSNTDLDTLDKECKLDKVSFEEKNIVYFLKFVHMDAAIVYNVCQMFTFGIMAGLVMRLKMLFVTQMCVVSSLVVNTKYYRDISRRLRLMWVVAAIIVARQLYVNMSHEMSHIGEFSDLQQEELLQWAAQETASGAAFAGSLPILAAVMLSARRPIVAHPHYEHHDARRRAYAVYKTYGRFSPQHLYQELKKLKATYLIVETKYCYGRSSQGCAFEDIWDIETPSLAGQPKLCHTLLTQQTDHFYRMFSNAHYSVFRIHDMSVRFLGGSMARAAVKFSQSPWTSLVCLVIRLLTYLSVSKEINNFEFEFEN